jgi:hypothetical protein
LVTAFGEAVFDVIESTPHRLLEVDGIGKTRLLRITAATSSHSAIKESWSCEWNVTAEMIVQPASMALRHS